MFVTTYRYRVLPAKLRRYLAIQQQADAIYRSESGHRIEYFRGTNDRCQWLEIHFYASEEARRATADKLEADQRMTALWTEFKSTLDPTFPSSVEEFRHYAHSDPHSAE